MRILLVCHDAANIRSYGAGLRTNNIWRALSRVGEVSVLVMAPAHTTALDTTPREGEIGRIAFNKPAVPWVTPETLKIRRLVAQVVAPGQFDLIVVRYLRLSMLVRGTANAPMLVDGDDLNKVESTIGKTAWQQFFIALKTQARKTVTRIALRKFAYVWYVNPLDMIKFPSRLGSVLPNVTDAPVSAPARVTDRGPRILMVGAFGYGPNAEAANYFMRHVLPSLTAAVPEIRFRLVGQCPAELAASWKAVPHVDVAGFVDDLPAEYASASAVVAPIFSGGGTQIKVLEALGHECGTVVSAFSAAGFVPHLQAGEHLLVAHNATDWTAHCLTLLNSPAQAAKLGRAGRTAVLKHYSFDSMADEVKATLQRLQEVHR